MTNPTGTAVANYQTEQRSLIDSLRHEKFQTQIRASLPPSVSLDRFTAVTIAAVNQNPDLLGADRQSFYNSVVKCAQEGLLPDGQDSVLNVYNTNVGTKDKPRWIKKVQYQRMVGGLLKQFTKAGIDAYAESVYENDSFDYWNDESGQHLIHKPTKLGKEKGERIGSYAVAKLASGRVIVQVMDMEDLARVRAASKSPDKGPWSSWPARMEQKSALHRLRKRVAIIDEQAAKELGKMDDEFVDDPEETPEQPRQAIPTPSDKRPASLQSVVDQSSNGEAPPDDMQSGDPGPQEGDII